MLLLLLAFGFHRNSLKSLDQQICGKGLLSIKTTRLLVTVCCLSRCLFCPISSSSTELCWQQ